MRHVEEWIKWHLGVGSPKEKIKEKLIKAGYKSRLVEQISEGKVEEQEHRTTSMFNLFNIKAAPLVIIFVATSFALDVALTFSLLNISPNQVSEPPTAEDGAAAVSG